jgi:hypothetical protein
MRDPADDSAPTKRSGPPLNAILCLVAGPMIAASAAVLWHAGPSLPEPISTVIRLLALPVGSVGVAIFTLGALWTLHWWSNEGVQRDGSRR